MSEKVIYVTDYVCKFAKDKDDPDCKNCDGKSFEENGNVCACSEKCPSYEKGIASYQRKIVKEKTKMTFSSYVLIGIALVIIGVIVWFFASGVEMYKQENPYDVGRFLNN